MERGGQGSSQVRRLSGLREVSRPTEVGFVSTMRDFVRGVEMMTTGLHLRIV